MFVGQRGVTGQQDDEQDKTGGEMPKHCPPTIFSVKSRQSRSDLSGQRQRLVLKLDPNAKDLSRLLIASAIVHNNIIIVCRNNLTLKDS